MFLASVYHPRVDRECLSWLWIISNEVIFFAALIVVFYMYKIRPLFGYLVLFTILLASVVVNLVEGLIYEFTYRSGVSRSLIATLKIHPINACQGYMVGVLFALIWFSFKNRKDDHHRLEFVVKFFKRILNSKFLRIVFIVVGLILMVGLIYLPFPIYAMEEATPEQKRVKSILSSILISVERGLIAISLCIFLIPSIVGKAGITRVIFGNRVFIPLARLNTSALLVHGVILMWYFFGKFQILRLDPKVLNFAFIALSLLSYILAVVFTLVFESPFITMEQILLCPSKRKKYSIKTSFYGTSLEVVKNDLMERKSNTSFELKKKINSSLVDKEEDKATNDSVKGSPKPVRMYPNINYSVEPSSEERQYLSEKFKKSNSLGNAKEFDDSKKEHLLNGSEDSKQFINYNEPLLDD